MPKETTQATRRPRGAHKVLFVDQEIAHIASVMPASLAGGRGGPLLSPRYWRARLHKLLDATHLTHSQLCAVDRLLLQLDAHETKHRPPEAANDTNLPLDISATGTPHPHTS